MAIEAFLIDEATFSMGKASPLLNFFAPLLPIKYMLTSHTTLQPSRNRQDLSLVRVGRSLWTQYLLALALRSHAHGRRPDHPLQQSSQALYLAS